MHCYTLPHRQARRQVEKMKAGLFMIPLASAPVTRGHVGSWSWHMLIDTNICAWSSATQSCSTKSLVQETFTGASFELSIKCCVSSIHTMYELDFSDPCEFLSAQHILCFYEYVANLVPLLMCSHVFPVLCLESPGLEQPTKSRQIQNIKEILSYISSPWLIPERGPHVPSQL